MLRGALAAQALRFPLAVDGEVGAAEQCRLERMAVCFLVVLLLLEQLVAQQRLLAPHDRQLDLIALGLHVVEQRRENGHLTAQLAVA